MYITKGLRLVHYIESIFTGQVYYNEVTILDQDVFDSNMQFEAKLICCSSWIVQPGIVFNWCLKCWMYDILGILQLAVCQILP